MCMFSAPSIPAIPAPPPVVPPPIANPADVAKLNRSSSGKRRRSLAAKGRSNTIKTSALGDTSAAPVVRKTALGA